MDRPTSARGRAPYPAAGGLNAAAGRLVLQLVVPAAILAVVTGCSSDSETDGAANPKPQPVPAEIEAACGHPGAIAQLSQTRLPVTVAKASCDLTGVIIEWKDGKDTVPGGDLGNPNGGTECSSPSGTTCPSVVLDGKTGAVTIQPAES